MRKLEFGDLFAAGRVLDALDLQNDINDVISNIQKKENSNTKKKTKAELDIEAKQFGSAIFYKAFSKASQKGTENLIYEFLAPIFEMKKDEVKKLPPGEVVRKIKEVATTEEWKDFFSQAADIVE